MILSGCVKQQCKFFWGDKGGFHNVFGDRPIKWPIAKKKTYQNMHPQLINMDLQECMVIKSL
jgi:hypothetical protein